MCPTIQLAVTQVVDYACRVVLSVDETVTASRLWKRRGKDEWRQETHLCDQWENALKAVQGCLRSWPHAPPLHQQLFSHRLLVFGCLS